jgi:hypothetical protein
LLLARGLLSNKGARGSKRDEANHRGDAETQG